MSWNFSKGDSDNFSKRKSNSDNEQAESHVLQCPRCHAKFAITASDIGKIANPRFHCPCCDSIFDAVDADLNIAALFNSDTDEKDQDPADMPYEFDTTHDESPIEEDDNNEYDEAEYEDAEEEEEEDVVVDDDDSDSEQNGFDDNYEDSYVYSEDNRLNSTYRSPSTDDSFDPFEDPDQDPESEQYHYKPISNIKFHDKTLNKEGATSSSKSSAPDTLNDTSPFTTRPSSTNLKSSSASDTDWTKLLSENKEPIKNSSISFSEGRNRNSTENAANNNFSGQEEQKRNSTLSSTISSIDRQYSFDFSDSGSSSSTQRSHKPARDSRVTEPPHTSEEHRMYREYDRKISSPVHAERNIPSRSAALITLLPIIVLFLFLVAVSFYTANTDKPNIFTSLLPNTHQLPPAGLVITDLKMKQVPLQSGEIVHLISGTLQNHTSKFFSNIVLEGVAFDLSGQVLVSKKVDAASTLSKSNIASFTPEMIEELQKQTPPQKYKFAANTSQDFAIGIISDNMREAKFYTARIYTAK